MTPLKVFEALAHSTNTKAQSSVNVESDGTPFATLLFALDLPKVELHAHLNGSISMALLRHLGKVRPATEPTVTDSATTTSSATTSSSAVLSLEDDALQSIRGAKERMAYCFGAFDCVYKIMDNLRYTRLAVQDMLLHYAVERMVFLEIRTSLREGLKASPAADAAIVTQADYLRTVRDAMSSILSGAALYDWCTGEAIDPTHGGEALTRWLDQLDNIYGTSCFLPRRLQHVLQEPSSWQHIVPGYRGSTSRLTPSLLFVQRIRPHFVNMRCALTVSISRSLPLAAAQGTVRVVEELLQEERARALPLSPSSVPITGIDFSGNCYKQEFSDFDAILRSLRTDHGLSVTVHAGEKADDKELQEMVDYAPDRWGHMIFAGDDLRRVIDFAVKKPIELCPSSNMLTCGHDHMDEHHIGQHWDIDDYVNLYKHGGNVRNIADVRAPVSINTDDRGVFASSMTDELLMVASRKDVSALPVEDRLLLLFVLQRRALQDGFYPKYIGTEETFSVHALEVLFDNVALLSTGLN